MLEVRTVPAAILVRVQLDYDFGWTNIPEETVLTAARDSRKPVFLDLNACTQIDTHGLLSLSRLHAALGTRLEIVLSNDARIAPIVDASGLTVDLPIVARLPRGIEMESTTQEPLGRPFVNSFDSR